MFFEDEEEDELGLLGNSLGIDRQASGVDTFKYSYSDDPDSQTEKALGKSAISAYLPQSGEAIPGELDSEKSLRFALNRNEQMLLANETAFNQLDLAGKKEDPDDDNVGQMVAQALLAFVPLAGGYLLGGNRGGVAGARAGLIGQKTFQDTLLKNEKKKELKSAAEQQRVLAERKELLKNRADLEKEERSADRTVEAEQRKYGPDGLLINYQAEKARRGLGDKGTNLTVDLSPIVQREAAKDFAETRRAIEGQIASAEKVEQAALRYLEKNPGAKDDTPLIAFARSLGDEIYPDEASLELRSSRALNDLKTTAALVKGAASDRDAVKIADAVITGKNVPIPDLIKLMRTAQKDGLISLERERATVQADPFSPSPFERAARERFGLDTGGQQQPLPPRMTRAQYMSLKPEQKAPWIKSGGKFLD